MLKPRQGCSACSHCCKTPREWTGSELAHTPRRPAPGRSATTSSACGTGLPGERHTRIDCGYRLGAAPRCRRAPGRREVVAVAIGLRTAAGGRSSGIEETSCGRMVKLEQVLPSRLRTGQRAPDVTRCARQTEEATAVQRRNPQRVHRGRLPRPRALRFDIERTDGDRRAGPFEPYRGWASSEPVHSRGVCSSESRRKQPCRGFQHFFSLPDY